MTRVRPRRLRPWAANYYDRNGDCDVDLSDFAVFAAAWMNDTGMQVQETRVQAADVDYLPKSVLMPASKVNRLIQCASLMLP